MKNLIFPSKIVTLAASWLAALLLGGCGETPEPKNNPVKNEPIIGLITDYGWTGSYTSQLKGAILSIHPPARILDLDHQMFGFDIPQTSYLVHKSTSGFPPGSIFIVVVDPGVGSGRRSILLETKQDLFYVGPDNGILSDVIRLQGAKKLLSLDQPRFYLGGNLPSRTFHGRDIFGPVAAHIAAGSDIAQIGTSITDPIMISRREVNTIGSFINGEVVYIDEFGNVITNIRESNAAELTLGNIIKVTLDKKNHSVPYLSTYADAKPDQVIALINSNGELEFAIPQGHAAQKLKAYAGMPVSIKK